MDKEVVEKESKKHIAPFVEMTVTADVDWDYDEDVKESGLAPEEFGLPDYKQVLKFTAAELQKEEVITAESDTEWVLDEDVLEEYISDVLTDSTGFCHNGFSYDYSTSIR